MRAEQEYRKNLIDIDLDTAESYLRSGNFSLVIYNQCYGGGTPTLNEAAAEVRNKYRQKGESEDLSLFHAVVEIGPEKACETRWTEFGLAFVKKGPMECVGTEYGDTSTSKDLAKYVKVHEYDGMETPYFQHDRYALDLLEEYVDSNGFISHCWRTAIKSVRETADSVEIYNLGSYRSGTVDRENSSR